LDSAISCDPTNSFSYQLKAEAQWFLGNYADAAETYKKMISLGDENLLKVSAYVFSGMLYGKAGMRAQATAQYISAVKLWESGYVPHKQFRLIEELDYFLALAFLEEKAKAMKIISERSLDSLSYPRRLELEQQNKRCLSLFEKTPKELLEEHFKEYMLPDNIKPLEE
jgi:tetratricopeptide (TPR) repeat protein